jgi:hypothetical protein
MSTYVVDFGAIKATIGRCQTLDSHAELCTFFIIWGFPEEKRADRQGDHRFAVVLTLRKKRPRPTVATNVISHRRNCEFP